MYYGGEGFERGMYMEWILWCDLMFLGLLNLRGKDVLFNFFFFVFIIVIKDEVR